MQAGNDGPKSLVFNQQTMPFYRYETTVPLSPGEVQARIRAVSCEDRGLHSASWLEVLRFKNKPASPFLGHIDNSSFCLRRANRSRNPFRPTIHGRISAISGGSKVTVTMYVNLVVALSTTFWLGIFGHIALDSPADKPAAVLMFAFGVGLVLVCFIREAIKAKRLLESALAKNVSSDAPKVELTPNSYDRKT